MCVCFLTKDENFLSNSDVTKKHFGSTAYNGRYTEVPRERARRIFYMKLVKGTSIF